MATTRSQTSSLPLTLAITLLRRRFLASSLADVLTSALGKVHSALYISICSPHAQQAGPDYTRSRRVAKLDFCANIFPPFSVKTFTAP